MNIPFYEFRFDKETERKLNEAHSDVLRSGVFILGRQLELFEKEAADYLGVKHAIGVGNGYDALYIALKSLSEDGPKRVLLQDNAYPATINAVINSGNTPVFYTTDYKDGFFSDGLNEFLNKNKIDVILPIYFFGAGNDLILDVGGCSLIEDFSQAFGTKIGSKYCGSIGEINACSLYPTKSLGALGDGGLITSNSIDRAKFCQQFRNYGEDSYNKLDHIGINSRLDEFQAAYLRVFLQGLDEQIRKKRQVVSRYFNELQGIAGLELPEKDLEKDIYHQFVIKTQKRDELKAHLLSEGINTKIHYPTPIIDQKAYSGLDFTGINKESLKRWHNENLSLPSFPEMQEEEIDFVCNSIKKFFK